VVGDFWYLRARVKPITPSASFNAAGHFEPFAAEDVIEAEHVGLPEPAAGFGYGTVTATLSSIRHVRTHL
jgi:hypothetical protein